MVSISASESDEIRREPDIIRIRQRIRTLAIQLRFSLVDQTKIVTAVSEIARNTLTYGGGGTVLVETVDDSGRVGLRLTFEDRGPGIADLDRALTDGYTTGNGLGLGLTGSRRLMNDFKIESIVGVGTKIEMTKWK